MFLNCFKRYMYLQINTKVETCNMQEEVEVLIPFFRDAGESVRIRYCCVLHNTCAVWIRLHYIILSANLDGVFIFRSFIYFGRNLKIIDHENAIRSYFYFSISSSLPAEISPPMEEIAAALHSNSLELVRNSQYCMWLVLKSVQR